MTEEEIILTHILQCRPIDLVINKPALTDLQQERFKSYKQRRQSGEPLQYILGSCNFMGLEMVVNPSVLVPRPETEQLIDAALKCFSGGTALDLGSGCGNIAIALAKFVPHSKVISVDISANALEVAKANAWQHKLEDRIQFIHQDLTEYLASLGNASFDLIISNPPYIPTVQLNSLPQDVQREPAAALDGGEDGLNFHRIIIKYTPCLLRRGACLMMEFGDGQAGAVKKLMEARKAFSRIEIIKDLAGRDRIIKAVI